MTPQKLTVLAEDVRPLAEVDAAALDQCIKNAEEDILHAKSDADRAKAVRIARPPQSPPRRTCRNHKNQRLDRSHFGAATSFCYKTFLMGGLWTGMP